MPMQKDTSSFIKQKLWAGDIMNGKKNRERFGIKFNENDPAHNAVIRLLEKQGPHSKAQFIVNAILHYINCQETPDIAFPQAVDRKAIEEIVIEILNRNGDRYLNRSGDINERKEKKEDGISIETKISKDESHKEREMDQVTLALIADTMSAF